MNYNLSGKTIIITGANSGIGKAASIQLAQLGAQVVIMCRSAERGAQDAPRSLFREVWPGWSPAPRSAGPPAPPGRARPALTALGRHLDALAATDARTRDFTDEERVVIHDIEERRAAFLRERGITEGPSLLSDERPDAAELARQIESTRAESEAVREALVRAEQELAQAEQLREQARRKLEAATKERLAAEKELERLRSVG